MDIIKKHLPESEYYPEITPKHQIVLHHTVASTFDSTWYWWQEDGIHVATAYIIDKDGTIYEMFNPDYWSYHLGRGTTTYNNKSAIGIELVNEGPLWKKDDKYYWWDGTAKFNNEVFEYDGWWRGHKYWAAYHKKQIDSLVDLLLMLTEEYKIKRKVIKHYGYDKDLLYVDGIISHHNVRTDKTDVSVALNLKQLQQKLDRESGSIIQSIKDLIWSTY